MRIRSILGALVIAACRLPVWAENMTPEDIKEWSTKP